MKLILIAYSEALDEEVMELLESCGTPHYTKWTRVEGRGHSSGPHLGSHVWPKANNVVAVAAEEGQAKAILDGVRALRQELSHEGVKAFQLPLEEVT